MVTITFNRKNVADRVSHDVRNHQEIIWLTPGTDLPADPKTIQRWAVELAEQGLELRYTGVNSVGSFVVAIEKETEDVVEQS